MREEKLGQEPAYPAATHDLVSGLVNSGKNPEGMSKRFYAACAATQGILSGIMGNQDMFYNFNEGASQKNHISLTSYIAEQAYNIADELLKQENL